MPKINLLVRSHEKEQGRAANNLSAEQVSSGCQVKFSWFLQYCAKAILCVGRLAVITSYSVVAPYSFYHSEEQW